jgi:hypothetical protein
MITPGHAGEADCAGQAVRDKGNPTMVSIAVGNDSGYGSSCHGMHGIEAAGVKSALPKCLYSMFCTLVKVESEPVAFKAPAITTGLEVPLT